MGGNGQEAPKVTRVTKVIKDPKGTKETPDRKDLKATRVTPEVVVDYPTSVLRCKEPLT